VNIISEEKLIEELANLKKMALRKFYLRPSVEVRFLSTVKSFHNLKKYFIGFRVLVKSRL